MQPARRFRRYIAISGAAATLALAAVLGLNFAVDPLWYFGGNRFFDQNYAFNERYSKTVLYMKHPQAYDCLIFGSSRTTLLDAGRIAGGRCFNFAISDGVAEEFIHFARYAERWGRPPRLVIVAVDDFALDNYPEATYVPDFVQDLSPPPSAIKSYASLSALGFSLRTVMRRPPFTRYYRSDFTAAIPSGLPPYDTVRIVDAKPEPPVYDTAALDLYAALVDMYDGARVIGYVPPISLWTIARMARDGTLDGYLRAIFAASRLFEAFYDFSVPSPLTADRAVTYDGSHYDGAVNARIAERLSGVYSAFGLAVHDLTEAQYATRFHDALAALSDDHDITLPTRLVRSAATRPE